MFTAQYGSGYFTLANLQEMDLNFIIIMTDINMLMAA